MVCTKAQNFADWKATILKLCKKTACSYEVVEAISNLADRAKKSVQVNR